MITVQDSTSEQKAQIKIFDLYFEILRGYAKAFHTKYILAIS
jgi:hypothetical protein